MNPQAALLTLNHPLQRVQCRFPASQRKPEISCIRWYLRHALCHELRVVSILQARAEVPWSFVELEGGTVRGSGSTGE